MPGRGLVLAVAAAHPVLRVALRFL